MLRVRIDDKLKQVDSFLVFQERLNLFVRVMSSKAVQRQ
jgi:hypothetical protein